MVDRTMLEHDLQGQACKAPKGCTAPISPSCDDLRGGCEGGNVHSEADDRAAFRRRSSDSDGPDHLQETRRTGYLLK